MKLEQLKTIWKIEEEKTFKGWDFSYINDRWESKPLPWNYEQILLSHIKPSDKLLDMGTGGGEFLLTLNHPYNLTSVTEVYPPNVELCKGALSPLGIDVRQVFDDNVLPFSADEFDIVMNRHESYNAGEVQRILKKGGYFITQQVGGKNDNDLPQKLINDFVPQFPNHNLAENIKLLSDVGFEIELSSEIFAPVKFYDVGALVYFSKMIEWEFPDFSVDSCFENLCKVQNELQDNGYVNGTQHRFIVVAKKI